MAHRDHVTFHQSERWKILLGKKIINLLVAHPLQIHCSFDYSGKAVHPPSRSPRFSIPVAVSPQCSAFITSINGLFALRSNQSAILTDTQRLFCAWSVWKATKGEIAHQAAGVSCGTCFLWHLLPFLAYRNVYRIVLPRGWLLAMDIAASLMGWFNQPWMYECVRKTINERSADFWTGMLRIIHPPLRPHVTHSH